MELLELLLQEIQKRKKPIYPLIGFAILSGLSSSFLIGIINVSAETVVNDELNWRYLILFTLCLSIFFYSKSYILHQSTEYVAEVINLIRRRLAEKVRLTELTTLEKYGTASIYARISQDTHTISDASSMIVNGAQQCILIVFVLFYIAAISPWSFGIVAVGIAIGSLYFLQHSASMRVMWTKLSSKETDFFEKLEHILLGFKEIRINRRKNEDVFETYLEVNDQVRDYTIKAYKHQNIFLIFLELLLFLILGFILFAMPKLHPEHVKVLIKVVSSVIFIISPLAWVLFSVPMLVKANNCACNIILLEAQLEEELKKLPVQQFDQYSPAAYQALPFESRVTLKGLAYQYPQHNSGRAGFQVGPIDLVIRKGELIFVTGGNGSGKSTFLKLLSGLYKPNAGYVELDGEEGNRGKVVSINNYQQYQNLFSIIFSDYHVFDKIYGVERKIDPAEVKILLQNMELHEDKITYENGSFTNLKLSSGQKKRLALAIALLEDKPIYILDEVAADLDPGFRDKFYFEILQEMRARHKTILVVTHDQQYWSACDRLIQFMDGTMRELSKEEVRSLVEMVLR